MTKKNAILVGAAGAVISLGMLALGYMAGNSQMPGEAVATLPQQSADRSEIELIVRDYLLANPDLLIDMQTALEERQREEQRVSQQQIISEAGDRIFNSKFDGIIGNPDGTVTIVEFFDYNCGFCKRALEDMQNLVETNPDLRFVLKEFPILGPESQQASVVSLAFHTIAPEKYGEFHNRLLGGDGRADEETAIGIALSLGVDEAALREAMENPEIMHAFAETYQLAEQLAITGTPSYVIGNEVVFGALGREVLAQKIEAARACTDGEC
ncbi:protein-disulfide isomerase [Mesorhizobium sp. J18]|uniref:DsbA family protein n=1 Tax=Mesorhizobium sp. J18 TaxID=935263 RepID=UPI00119BDCB9|nr:DsbA family protein [Mesorhizobium sp. J18]TWG93873.1 protein-disulfide isomerase [Mesorhizobium sp. J18]